MTIIENISLEIPRGNSENVEKLVKQALAEEIPAETILNKGLIEGMNVVSVRFKNNECFLPEVLISARAMSMGLDILKPWLAQSNVRSLGRVVIGSIQGDLHDIGKNIVAMLLQGAGFEVIDLGADVPVDKFVESAKKEKADLVGISSLLITTMIHMKSVVDGLKSAGIKDRVKVIIGGAPVTQDFADDIGADGYAPDAATGVDVAKDLLKI